MNRKEEKMLGILKHRAKIYTDMLTKNVNNTIDSTKILIKNWENILSEYIDTALHTKILSYQRSLTSQMELKDKLIDKLQKELDECIEYRFRTGQRNLELVNTTLAAFKKDIEETHHQYQAELELALPVDLAELEVRTGENDIFWRMLKYDKEVVQIETEKWKSDIKNKHIENIDIERARHDSIMNKFCWKDYIMYYKDMKDVYTFTLKDYMKKTKTTAKEYSKFKKQDENLLIAIKQLKNRSRDLLNEINALEKEMGHPKLLKELNMLKQKRDEVEEGLKQFRNKVTNNSELGIKQKSLLFQSTKQINSEVSIILKKGNDIMSCIHSCQELETPEEKANIIPIFNEHENNEEPDHQSLVQGLLSNIRHQMSSIRIQCKDIDEKNDKLQHENNELKEKIYNIVNQLKYTNPNT